MIKERHFVLYVLSWSDMQAFRNDQLNFLAQVAQEKGCRVHMKMMGMDIYLIADADLMQPLLIEHVDKLHRDPFTKKIFRRMTGNGVFVAEDEAWKYQRKMMQPAFHSQRIGSYADTIVQYTEDMLQNWTHNQILQLDDVFSSLTQRIIVKTMFNRDIEAFTTALGQSMNTLLSIAESQLSALPIPEWMPTIPRWQQHKARQQILDLIDSIIEERVQNPHDYGDLLSMLLEVRDEKGEALSYEQIRDECMTLFIAGHETTAVTLTWALHLLAQNPEVVSKLEAEIDAVLNGNSPTLSDVEKLPYAEMVIKETLRLYPPAWSFGRVALEDISLDDEVIEKDSIIFFNTYILHRQAEYFPEPEQFQPERFNKDKQSTYPRYAYLPFGAGRRICIGNQFAMLESILILSRIVQEYRFMPITDEAVIAEPMITLRPLNGLKMKLLKR